MQNEKMPAEGQNSTKLEAESALRGAELEKRMVTGERVNYREHLVQICDSDFHAGTHWSTCSVHANARQRCLAYLKTKGIIQ